MDPPGVLPQAARVVDNSLPIHPTEILVDVEMLNIDAASFTQMKEAAAGDPDRIAAIIMDTVRQRGKQHNPVTGSGGMLVGRVREVGADYRGPLTVAPGDRLATLVSLSLTPLHLEGIDRVFLDRDQVAVRGHAILFESGIAALLPDDIPRDLALAALDVSGAPAQTARMVRPGMKVGILGTGKSGLLCAAVARRILGTDGMVVGIAHRQEFLEPALRLGYLDTALVADARNPVEVFEAVHQATGGTLLDLALNTTNVPGTEMATILSTRDGGTAYFFNMATSFTAAALGAEGAGKDVALLMGNGYVPGHAQLTLDLLRSDPGLRSFMENRFCNG
jgi:L-erythro-3,5-diaminohexanoate dehydrogenase